MLKPWSGLLWICLITGCAVQSEDPAAPAILDHAQAASCGVSPTSISYWATEWQRDIMDADGLIGSCVFGADCLPSCWGLTSDWTTFAGPIFACPCP